MTLRILLLIFSISIISACGGGGGGDPEVPDGDGDGDIVNIDGDGDQDIDEQNPAVELQIKKDRNWVAVEGSTLELIPYGRVTDSGEDFSERTKGDIYWTIISGGEYASIEQVQRRANVTALNPCPDDNPYCVEVELKLDSSTGEIYTETVKLLVKENEENLAPQANAGEDQTVTGGDTVTLDGSNSLDLDGSVTNYTWSVVSGPLTEEDISGINTDSPSFVVPESKYDQSITLKLVVTDDQGLVNYNTDSTVTITVLKSLDNLPPIAVADQSQFSVLPTETISLSCLNSSDPDEPSLLNCTWTEISTARTPETCPDLTFQTESPEQPFYAYIEAPDTGTDTCQYNFDLIVTDTDGATDSLAEESFITIVITPPEQNQKPVTIAKAYPEGDSSNPQKSITVNENTRVCLSGEGSFDPDGDSSNLAFNWEQVANSADTVNPESPDSIVTCLNTPETTIQQTLKYSLTAVETTGEDPLSSGKAYVEITVLPVNSAPVAELAEIAPVQTYGEVILDASGSQDTDDNETSHIVKYNWKIVSTTPELDTGYDIELLPVSPCSELETCPKAKFITPVISEELKIEISVTVEDNEGTESEAAIRTATISVFDITPYNPGIQSQDESSASLSWQSDYSQIEGLSFSVETAPSLDGPWQQVLTTSSLSADISNLTTENANYFRIAGIYQDTIAGTASAPVVHLHAPENIIVTDDNNLLALSWDHSDGADSYDITVEHIVDSQNSYVYKVDSVSSEQYSFANTYNKGPFRVTIKPHATIASDGIESQIDDIYILRNEWKNANPAPFHFSEFAATSYTYGGKHYLAAINELSLGIYDIENQKWKMYDLPSGREGASIEYLNGRIYLIGGDLNKDNDSHYFDLSTKKWTNIGDFFDIKNHASTTNGESIFVAGGEHDSGEPSFKVTAISNSGDDAPVIPDLPGPAISYGESIDLGGTIFELEAIDNQLFAFILDINQTIIGQIDLDNPTAGWQPAPLFSIPNEYPEIKYIFDFHSMPYEIDTTTGRTKSILVHFEYFTDDLDFYKALYLFDGQNWELLEIHEKGTISNLNKNPIEILFINNHMYLIWETRQVFGGTLMSYKISETSLDYSILSELYSGPIPRYDATTTSIDNKLYLIGGIDSNGLIRQIESFDPETETWLLETTIPISDDVYVSQLEAVTIDDTIFIIYTTGTRELETNLISYNNSTKTWNTSLVSPATVREGFCITAHNDKLYLLGGEGYFALNHDLPSGRYAEVFENNQWTLLSSVFNPSSMIPQTHNHAGCISNGNEILLMGGQIYSEEERQLIDTDEISSFQPETNTWQTANFKLPEGMSYVSPMLINHQLYVSGAKTGPLLETKQYVGSSNYLGKYDSTNNQWIFIDSLQKEYQDTLALPIRPSISAHRGTIHILGGYHLSIGLSSAARIVIPYYWSYY